MGDLSFVKKFILLFFLTIAVGTFYVSANGAQEDRISQAKTLIEQKKYNDAILLLTQEIREHPDRLDQAEALLRQIRQISQAYNKKYDELIQVLTVEKNVEKALGIISELEQLDPTPNQATASAVETARKSADSVFSSNLIKEIMTKAAQYIAAGDYWAAAQEYTRGFELRKTDFDRSEYGNVIKNELYTAVDTLNSIIAGFIQQKSAISEFPASLASFFSREGTLAGYAGMLGPVDYIASYRMNLKTQLTRIDNIITQLPDVLTNSGSYYPIFLHKIIAGRAEAATAEGLAGLGQILWESMTTDVYTKTRSALTAAWDSAIREYTSSGSIAGFGTAKLAAMYITTAVSRESLISPVPAGFSVNEEVLSQISSRLPEFVTAVNISNLADAYIAFAEKRAIWDASGADTQYDDETRSFVVSQWDWLTAGAADLASVRTRLSAIPVPDWDFYRIDDRYAELARMYSSRATVVREREVAIVAKNFEDGYSALADRYAFLSDEYTRANGLFQGVERTGEGSLTAYKARYPDQAQSISRTIQSSLAVLRSDSTATLTRLAAEKDWVVARNELVSIRTRVQQIIASSDTLVSRARNLEGQAATQIAAAARLKNEAELRVREAEQALAANQFDIARTRIALARERYSASLDIQDSDQLRAVSDTQLLDLSDRVTQTERAVVVLEVRGMITQGKNYYLQGTFDRAEQIFQSAQARWLVVNSEENDEVIYWLKFIQAALSVTTGRTLPESAPLYPEMRQLLNLARDDYERGKLLVSQGKKRDALSVLDQAESKLLKVRIPFPFNQEASVLSLRILQLRDTDNFMVVFGERVNAARVKMRTSPQEAYTELKDLYEINPSYPGLSAAIYNAEIQLGIRILPPDPKAIAESQSLYERAADIVRRNLRDQFPVALDQLNRAIEVWPDNQLAITLKDKVSLEVGGQATVVLSSQAERLYRQAEQAYVQGNYLGANALVQELIKDPKTARYPPLIELKRRIEARL